MNRTSHSISSAAINTNSTNGARNVPPEIFDAVRPSPSNTVTAFRRVPAHTVSAIASVNPNAAWVNPTRATMANTVNGRSAATRRRIPPTSPCTTPWTTETRNSQQDQRADAGRDLYGEPAVPENQTASRLGRSSCP